MSNKITRNEIHEDIVQELDSVQVIEDSVTAHLEDGAAHGIGNKATLLTTNKTSIVAALNELFTNANSLKSDWAGVVGSPLISGDTSAQLKSKTQTIKNSLATNLTAKGQTATGTETLTALVNKVANVNTGKKFASGTLTSSANGSFTIANLDFTPSKVFIESRGTFGSSDAVMAMSLSNANDFYYGMLQKTTSRYVQMVGGSTQELASDTISGSMIIANGFKVSGTAPDNAAVVWWAYE